MRIINPVIVGLCIFLSSCANYGSFLSQATDHADEARDAISRGDGAKANEEIDYAIGDPKGNLKVRVLFSSHPQAKAAYLAYLERLISDVSLFYQATNLADKFSMVKSAELFSATQMSELSAKLSNRVSEGNAKGTFSIDLSDKIDNFPILNSPVQQQIIVNRSIEKLQGHGSRPGVVEALMQYVRRVGVDSPESKRIEALLPTMNIRSDELDAVAKIYPKFSEARKEQITSRVYLQFKSADRLLSDDILQMLRNRVRGVQWVSTAGPKTTTLVIERLRNEEKTLPERSRTITYSQSDVNILSAALLMPRNASYLFDLISGGAEIEYGYVVAANLDGKSIFDEVVRGTVGGEYHTCQNARIQNVFGGVSPAGFVANDDMQSKCSGTHTISINELRKDVLSKVVDTVLRVPTINAAQKLN